MKALIVGKHQVYWQYYGYSQRGSLRLPYHKGKDHLLFDAMFAWLTIIERHELRWYKVACLKCSAYIKRCLISLQLSPRLLERRKQEVPDIPCGLVEIETHPITPKTLADNVKLNAANHLASLSVARKQRYSPVLIDHICDAEPLIDNLTPSIPIEVF